MQQLELFKKFVEGSNVKHAAIILLNEDGTSRVMLTPGTGIITSIGMVAFLHEYVRQDMVQTIVDATIDEHKPKTEGDVN
jgi:hypothetical protein